MELPAPFLLHCSPRMDTRAWGDTSNPNIPESLDIGVSKGWGLTFDQTVWNQEPWISNGVTGRGRTETGACTVCKDQAARSNSDGWKSSLAAEG